MSNSLATCGRSVVFGLLTLLAWQATASPSHNCRAAEPAKAAGAPLPAEVRTIARSNDQFALDLYGRLRARDGNLFFSPTSISAALAMTYAGAEGETQREMAQVLHLQLAGEQVHPAFAALLANLQAPPQAAYELRIANRLWGQTGYDFRREYLDTTRRHYGAELAQVDFRGQPENVRVEINRWVEKQTHDRIVDLLPSGSITGMTRLVLTNAVYFKGTWSSTFDKRATRPAAFTTADGERVEVPLMYQSETFGYAENDLLQILEMPYRGDDLSMVILLPKQRGALKDVEDQLTTENLAGWLKQLGRAEVQSYVPRFKLTEQFSLNATLAGLGMPSAFDPREANFAGMNGRRDLYISDAVHKAFVDVNEEGTEAAAATGIVFGVTSAPSRIERFRADHPFVFMIRHRATGGILFLGRLSDPAAE